jgi:TolB protein
MMKNKILKHGLFIISFSILLLSCKEELFFEPISYGQISGRVLNYESKKSEGAVLVRLNPSGKSIETDSLGNFKFDSLSLGKYTIQATKIGLFTEYVTVEILTNSYPQPTIYMSKNIVKNSPPEVPTLMSPKNDFIFDSDKITLVWNTKDVDKDTLKYDVYLFKEGEGTKTLVATNFAKDTLEVGGLLYNTKYYWQVVASDDVAKTYSEVWSFKTLALPELNYVYVKEINSTLQIVASNGPDSDERILTSTGNNWRPIVNPAKTEVAFLSNRYKGENHIFIMNMDGSNVHRVTSFPISSVFSDEISFSWASNGGKIIFPNYKKLFYVNKDGTELTEFAHTVNGTVFVGCDWNESKRIVIARTLGESIYDSEILLIKEKEVVSVIKEAYRMSTPMFSIDGNSIVYSKDVNSYRDYYGRQLDARIFIYDFVSKTSKDYSRKDSGTNTGKPMGTNDLEPRYSPNNSAIIFSNASNETSSDVSIYTLDISTNTRLKILSNAMMGTWRKQ